MNYKNLSGSINYSKEDQIFFGKLESVNDLVTFEGKDLSQLYNEFKLAVDDYLNTLLIKN